jgi:integrase/recombinase XerD
LKTDLSVEAFENYLRAVKAPNTAVKYAQSAERFLSFLEQKQIPSRHLPPGIVGTYAQWLVEAGLQSRSVHVMVAGAKSYLEWCRGQGEAIPILSRTPLPKVLNAEPNALSPDILLQYLHHASRAPEPIRTALLLHPYIGLRPEELMGVSLNAIRPVSLPMRGGGHEQHIVFVIRGKGGELRMVPVLLDGRHLLVKYLQNWRMYQAGNWLFPMPDGGHCATRTLRHYVQKIREHIGANRLTPHTMRRTYLTALWKSGVDVVSLTKIAGHKSIQTTMTHYLEVRPEDMAGAVSRAGSRLIVRGPEEQLSVAQQRMSEFMSTQPKLK